MCMAQLILGRVCKGHDPAHEASREGPVLHPHYSVAKPQQSQSYDSEPGKLMHHIVAYKIRITFWYLSCVRYSYRARFQHS